MADEQFKPGDVVQLKSGGPQMTISFYQNDLGSYVCQWFVKTKLEEGIFSPEAIRKVEDKDDA